VISILVILFEYYVLHLYLINIKSYTYKYLIINHYSFIVGKLNLMYKYVFLGILYNYQQELLDTFLKGMYHYWNKYKYIATRLWSVTCYCKICDTFYNSCCHSNNIYDRCTSIIYTSKASRLLFSSDRFLSFYCNTWEPCVFNVHLYTCIQIFYYCCNNTFYYLICWSVFLFHSSFPYKYIFKWIIIIDSWLIYVIIISKLYICI